MRSGLLTTTAVALTLATTPVLAQSGGSGTQDMQQNQQRNQQTQQQNQQKPQSQTGAATSNQPMAGDRGRFIAEPQENDVLADELIGTTVRTTNGESVGDVQDLLVNENNGIEAIVIGVGGFLGMGEKTVAVNFSEVQRNRTDDGTLELVLATDRAALENAPEFTSRNDGQRAQAK